MRTVLLQSYGSLRLDMEVTRLFCNVTNILGDPIWRSPDGKVMFFLCRPNRLRNLIYFAAPPSGDLQMDWGTTRHPHGLQTSYRHVFCIWRSPDACAHRIFFVNIIWRSPDAVCQHGVNSKYNNRVYGESIRIFGIGKRRFRVHELVCTSLHCTNF